MGDVRAVLSRPVCGAVRFRASRRLVSRSPTSPRLCSAMASRPARSATCPIKATTSIRFRNPLPDGAHRYPDLCSRVVNGTRGPETGTPILRPRQRPYRLARAARPPTEGRRERVRAHGTPALCLKPCLPSPGALRAPAPLRSASRGEAYGRRAAEGPSSLRVGVHFLPSSGCSNCGAGGLSRDLGEAAAEGV